MFVEDDENGMVYIVFVLYFEDKYFDLVDNLEVENWEVYII